jgi:hypothetical protein
MQRYETANPSIIAERERVLTTRGFKILTVDCSVMRVNECFAAANSTPRWHAYCSNPYKLSAIVEAGGQER